MLLLCRGLLGRRFFLLGGFTLAQFRGRWPLGSGLFLSFEINFLRLQELFSFPLQLLHLGLSYFPDHGVSQHLGFAGLGCLGRWCSLDVFDLLLAQFWLCLLSRGDKFLALNRFGIVGKQFLFVGQRHHCCQPTSQKGMLLFFGFLLPWLFQSGNMLKIIFLWCLFHIDVIVQPSRVGLLTNMI